jgi:DNA-binding NtrC family response regulator
MSFDFKLLIVDDEAEIRSLLSDLLEDAGYIVDQASTGDEAISKYKEDDIDAVISDIIMPEMNGIELLQKLKKIDINANVIMITGSNSVENAIQALRMGAEDYFTKPINNIEILKVVERIYKSMRLQRREKILKNEILRQDISEIVGVSSKIKKLFSDINMVSNSDIPVFITGESGTGKELVARAIHNLSPRKEEPFVAVNCAAIPNDLLESEFFGHEKGAFSGAINKKFGLFETANKGTLLLDEIGEMPASLQAKLLRTVETMTFRRIGGTAELSVDVRLVSCTNREIKDEIKTGSFRPDLFYRLSTFTISIPPIRERKSDIIPIMNHYLKKRRKEEIEIPNEIIEAFKHYDWPGNVRELEHVLERLFLFSKQGPPQIKNLPPEIQQAAQQLPVVEPQNTDVHLEPLKNVEEKHIYNILEHCGGDKKVAAKILGIGLRTLYRKIDHTY